MNAAMWIAGSIVVVGCSAAAAQDYAAARAVAAEVEAAFASHQWDRAQRRLTEGRAACLDGLPGSSCRMLLDFNLGYLYQQQSEHNTEHRQQLLSTSAAHYEEVLAGAPGHAATMLNLSLVRAGLGQVDLLSQLLTKASAANELGVAATIAMLIGEVQSAAARWSEAYQAYAQAADLAPRDEVARFKMIEAYKKLPANRTAEFLETARSWEQRFPTVAREGYRAVVQKTQTEEKASARVALDRWIVLSADQRAISASTVMGAFQGVDFAPVHEFIGFLKVLEESEPGRFRDVPAVEAALRDKSPSWQASHWSAVQHRHLLGLAALAVGRASVVAQNPEQAERQWVLGLQYGPQVSDYVFGHMQKETFVPLELVTELAWLEFRYPELDRSERKFKHFINLLFRSKGAAYEAGDLAAIQRHHTVLGEIFAAKGVWQGGWADNAIFQLSHAIRIAERRQREKNDPYQPQAGIRALLADGYDKVGDRHQALTTAISAVQAYLDTDELDHAATLTRRIELWNPPQKERAQIEALRHILTQRQEVDAARRAGSKGKAIERVPIAGSLERTDAHHLPADFLNRQQFKIDADLIEVPATGVGEAGKRAADALSSSQRVSTLVGTGDVLRLERARAVQPSVTSGTASGRLRVRQWRVYFDRGSATPLKDSRAQLKRVADATLAPGARAMVRIVGYSDALGDAHRNLTLAERRANLVANDLMKLGVAKQQMQVKAVGEVLPPVPHVEEDSPTGNGVVLITIE